jgi:hypothetical protein
LVGTWRALARGLLGSPRPDDHFQKIADVLDRLREASVILDNNNDGLTFTGQRHQPGIPGDI